MIARTGIRLKFTIDVEPPTPGHRIAGQLQSLTVRVVDAGFGIDIGRTFHQESKVPAYKGKAQPLDKTLL